MIRTKAAILHRTDETGPFANSRPLSVEEVELDPPGPGEALVRVAAAGLCHSDLSVINNSRPRPLPMVLGHEAAGVVEDVGQGVTYVRPGDHVVFSFVPACGTCPPCGSGRPALCEAAAQANTAGTLISGSRPFRRADGRRLHQHLGISAFAERTVTSVNSLVRVPSDIPPERAALFGCAVLTGIGAVTNTARPRPGTSAAVFGLGGIGLSVVMGAYLAGCHPIVAVDPSPAKRELAGRVGATHTLTADAQTTEQLRAITGGGADHAFEAVGDADVLATAYASTHRGGTTVSVGLPHPSRELRIPAVSLVTEERHLTGSYMGSAVPRRDIPRLIALHQAGRLPVDVLHTHSARLEEINTGFDDLAEARAVRTVVIPDGPPPPR